MRNISTGSHREFFLEGLSQDQLKDSSWAQLYSLSLCQCRHIHPQESLRGIIPPFPRHSRAPSLPNSSLLQLSARAAGKGSGRTDRHQLRSCSSQFHPPQTSKNLPNTVSLHQQRVGSAPQCQLRACCSWYPQGGRLPSACTGCPSPSSPHPHLILLLMSLKNTAPEGKRHSTPGDLTQAAEGCTSRGWHHHWAINQGYLLQTST